LELIDPLIDPAAWDGDRQDPREKVLPILNAADGPPLPGQVGSERHASPDLQMVIGSQSVDPLCMAAGHDDPGTAGVNSGSLCDGGASKGNVSDEEGGIEELASEGGSSGDAADDGRAEDDEDDDDDESESDPSEGVFCYVSMPQGNLWAAFLEHACRLLKE